MNENQELKTDIKLTAEFIRKKLGLEVNPSVGIICGSGLSNLGEMVTESKIITYQEIPSFPTSEEETVELKKVEWTNDILVLGHKNNFLFGKIGNKSVVCMQGRFHPYEYKNTALCALPVRVMVELGMKTLLLTNAAGGCNNNFNRGDLMLIKDHLFIPGLALQGPLIGTERYISMTNAYDKQLRSLAKQVAIEQGITVQEGVYGMSSGPHFETPAEVRMFKVLGADCIGMSTCHEVVVARQCGISVLGISLISNICSDDSDNPIETTHNEVLETGRIGAQKAASFVSAVVQAI